MSPTPKDYPTDFANQYIQVIQALSITQRPFMVGTFSKKGMLYPADVDMNETIRSPYSSVKRTLSTFENQLKNIVRRLMKLDFVIIGDMKAGQMGNEPVRWKPQDVLKGKKGDYLLKNAFQDQARIKIDAVAYLQDVFVEFSMIYHFEDHQGKPMNVFEAPTLQQSIKDLKKQKKYFKMAKRMYSLRPTDRLLQLFNGNAGSMYQIMSFIDTILYLLETKRIPPTDKRIDEELDGLITRLNLLDDKSLDKNERINKLLKSAQQTNRRLTLMKELERIKSMLATIVNDTARRFLRIH